MTPVGVFFICQNEDKCHFVNSTMLARCSGPIGMKKRPDSMKLFERKKHGIQLYCDNFRTGCQTGPVRWPDFF